MSLARSRSVEGGSGREGGGDGGGGGGGGGGGAGGGGGSGGPPPRRAVGPLRDGHVHREQEDGHPSGGPPPPRGGRRLGIPTVGGPSALAEGPVPVRGGARPTNLVVREDGTGGERQPRLLCPLRTSRGGQETVVLRLTLGVGPADEVDSGPRVVFGSRGVHPPVRGQTRTHAPEPLMPAPDGAGVVERPCREETVAVGTVTLTVVALSPGGESSTLHSGPRCLRGVCRRDPLRTLEGYGPEV